MNRKNMLALLAAMLVFALVLTACGNKQAPETTAATTQPAEVTSAAPVTLGLADWTMSASTWSSPNGATIHISATPVEYADGLIAAFDVRLEGEDVANIPCEWDGTSYTASADLNAANGYSYYVILTAADGSSEEIAVNPASEPTNEAFVNMEDALASYCSIIVEESSFADGKLTLTSGTVQVQAPTITDDGAAIACKQAELVLSFAGEELGRQTITPAETDTAGLFEAALKDITFDVPEMESEQKLDLYLNVTLTNDQELTAFGGNWFYNDEGMLPVVG